MNDDHVDLVLPDYILETLNPDEQDHIARHLRVCPHCRHLAETDRATLEQLCFAAPRHQPPPYLKWRLMERVSQESSVERERRRERIGDVSAERRPMAVSPVEPRQRARPRIPGWLLAAALVPWVLVVALGVTLMASRPGPLPAPTLSIASMQGPHGEHGHLAMVAGGTKAFLTLTHMPHLPAHKIYICWLKRDTIVERACVFHLLGQSDDAMVALSAARPLGEYSLITVSMETSLRVTRPTGTFLATGRLQ